jgi:hypothetical protein
MEYEGVRLVRVQPDDLESGVIFSRVALGSDHNSNTVLAGGTHLHSVQPPFDRGQHNVQRIGLQQGKNDLGLGVT